MSTGEDAANEISAIVQSGLGNLELITPYHPAGYSGHNLEVKISDVASRISTSGLSVLADGTPAERITAAWLLSAYKGDDVRDFFEDLFSDPKHEVVAAVQWGFSHYQINSGDSLDQFKAEMLLSLLETDDSKRKKKIAHTVVMALLAKSGLQFKHEPVKVADNIVDIIQNEISPQTYCRLATIDLADTHVNSGQLSDDPVLSTLARTLQAFDSNGGIVTTRQILAGLREAGIGKSQSMRPSSARMARSSRRLLAAESYLFLRTGEEERLTELSAIAPSPHSFMQLLIGIRLRYPEINSSEFIRELLLLWTKRPAEGVTPGSAKILLEWLDRALSRGDIADSDLVRKASDAVLDAATVLIEARANDHAEEYLMDGATHLGRVLVRLDLSLPDDMRIQLESSPLVFSVASGALSFGVARVQKNSWAINCLSRFNHDAPLHQLLLAAIAFSELPREVRADPAIRQGEELLLKVAVLRSEGWAVRTLLQTDDSANTSEVWRRALFDSVTLISGDVITDTWDKLALIRFVMQSKDVLIGLEEMRILLRAVRGIRPVKQRSRNLAIFSLIFERLFGRDNAGSSSLERYLAGSRFVDICLQDLRSEKHIPGETTVVRILASFLDSLIELRRHVETDDESNMVWTVRLGTNIAQACLAKKGDDYAMSNRRIKSIREYIRSNALSALLTFLMEFRESGDRSYPEDESDAELIRKVMERIDVFSRTAGADRIPFEIVLSRTGYRDGERTLGPISAKIRSGELTLLLGPSGAGKTTFVDLLLQALKPTAGIIGIRGLSGEKISMAPKRAVVPQENIAPEGLATGEYLNTSAALRSAPSDVLAVPDRVKSALFRTRMELKEKSLIGTLSGGQKRRLAFATELLSDPDLLVLDEPTAGLDPGLERDLFEDIARIAHEEGRAVLLVTHQPLALDVADNVIFLGAGGTQIFAGRVSDFHARFDADDDEDLANLYHLASSRDESELLAKTAGGQDEETIHASLLEPSRTIISSFSEQVKALSKRSWKAWSGTGGIQWRAMLYGVIGAIFAGLVCLAFGREGFLSRPPLERALFMSCFLAFWIPSVEAAMRVSQERRHVLHEMSMGLRSGAYTLAQVILTSLISFWYGCSLIVTVLWWLSDLSAIPLIAMVGMLAVTGGMWGVAIAIWMRGKIGPVGAASGFSAFALVFSGFFATASTLSVLSPLAIARPHITTFVSRTSSTGDLAPWAWFMELFPFLLIALAASWLGGIWRGQVWKWVDKCHKQIREMALISREDAV